MEQLFQHFRKEEQPFIEQVEDWLRQVDDYYTPYVTDFLNPRERYIVETLTNRSSFSVQEDGGFDGAERARMIIYPAYVEPTREDFQLTVREIQYASKFVTIEHPDVLGAMMSLGLDRSKFGDIVVQDDRIQIAYANEIDSYVQANFVEVGSATIRLKEPTERLCAQVTLHEGVVIVSSLRLDVIVTALARLGRQKAQQLIERERVKLNFQTVTDQAEPVQFGDLLSIRTLGRFHILEIEGRTKKEKWIIRVGKVIS